MKKNHIHPGWIVLGFLLGLAGGIPGVIMGINLAFGSYRRIDKIWGIIILLLSVAMTFVWFFSVL